MQAPQEFIAESRSFLSVQLFPRIRAAVEVLSDEQVWWRPNEESNSIGNLLLHLSGNVRQWIVSGLGEDPDTRNRQSEFDERTKITSGELLGILEGTVQEADRVLEGFDPGRLLEKRVIQGHDVTPLYAVYHVVEHFSMHAGQIIYISKMLTAKDLEFYKMDGDTPNQNWRV